MMPGLGDIREYVAPINNDPFKKYDGAPGFGPGAKLYSSLFGGKSQNDTAAGDAYAAMTRQSWYDYMNTLGVPQEQKLIEYATNPETVNNAMTEASSDVTGAFDRQQAATQRRLSGLGLTLNADEQAASDRSTNLARSLGDVGAQNRARDQTLARQQAIISGGRTAPTLGSVR